MPPAGLSSRLLGPDVSGPPANPTLWLIGGVGETGNPISAWADQTPLHHDQTNATVGKQPVPGTGINAKATVDFTDTHPDFLSDAGDMLSTYYSAAAFSIGVVWKYTGAKNYAANAICPQPVGITDNSNPLLGAGFQVGLNPGDATAIQCSGRVNDGAANHVATATGAAGSAANPHYSIATFGGGTLTTYLDALAPVATAAIGNVADLTRGMQIGIAQTSTSQDFNGSLLLVITYNRLLTGAEVTQLQKYLKKTGGFP